MNRFPLKEATIKIRDVQVRVRELTQAERNKFAAADKFEIAALIASMGTIDPPMTAEQAAAEPSEVIEELVEQILTLTGMRSKKDAVQKEPDAR